MRGQEANKIFDEFTVHSASDNIAFSVWPHSIPTKVHVGAVSSHGSVGNRVRDNLNFPNQQAKLPSMLAVHGTEEGGTHDETVLGQQGG